MELLINTAEIIAGLVGLILGWKIFDYTLSLRDEFHLSP